MSLNTSQKREVRQIVREEVAASMVNQPAVTQAAPPEPQPASEAPKKAPKKAPKTKEA